MTTTETAANAQVANAVRAIEGALLAVHVMLAARYVQLASLQVIAPVSDHFFPVVLRHPAFLLAAFFSPVLTEVIVLDRPTPTAMRWAAGVEAAGAAVLLVHQASYFFATWVVVFWAALFLVWLAWSAAQDDVRARIAGPFVAQLLVAFLFMGGAVGKWTAGYWSGDVFYGVFFAGNPSPIYALLRSRFDVSTLHLIAMWFSRAVVVLETSMALVILLPARRASMVSIAAALGLWLTSGDLFEVSWPLIGIALAGRLLAQPTL